MRRTILFICTGNIFRSMIAEHALRTQLGGDPTYAVSSAGTTASPMEMYPPVRARLVALGADPASHVQTRLTADILDDVDLPVAMSTDHRDFISQKFGREVVLFNWVCFGSDEALLDLGEALPDWSSDPKAAERYTVQMVDTIWDAMPHFITNIPTFLR